MPYSPGTVVRGQNFLFIHLHKTGGQFVREFLLEHMPATEDVGYHYPRRLTPMEDRDKPVIGFVRNPWAWYVSWYSFNAKQPMKNPLFRVLSQRGKNGFDKTVRHMLAFGADTRRAQLLRERLDNVLPDTLDGNRGVGLTRECVASFDDPSTGYYSWQFQRMFGVGTELEDLAHIGRTENLRGDLLRLLTELDIPLGESAQVFLDSAGNRNSSEHRPYQEYYNDDLREEVRRQDAYLIERYGYEF